MSSDWLRFSVDSYGIVIDSAPIYFNITWGLLFTIATIMIFRKIIKGRRK